MHRSSLPTPAPRSPLPPTATRTTGPRPALRRLVPALAALAALAFAGPAAGQATGEGQAAEAGTDAPADPAVAGALLAAPPAQRADAEVRAADGETVLRAGDGALICLADAPGDGRYRVACYHRSLEPFMAMGRRLAAEGVEGMERQQARWDAADAGRLEMPSGPAMVYNLGFPTEDVDPATADWSTAGRLHAIYMPWATTESTGLPAAPDGAAPWLMWPGEASAHVMIAVPPSEGGGG